VEQICDCPFGFEDGHVVGYEADSDRLQVTFEFWNEKHRNLRFEEFQAMHDNCAIGVTIGSANQSKESELIARVVQHQFDEPPKSMNLRHYQFLDLDDNPVLEVVAESCSFTPCPEVRGGEYE
jgi:hypothetical protein